MHPLKAGKVKSAYWERWYRARNPDRWSVPDKGNDNHNDKTQSERKRNNGARCKRIFNLKPAIMISIRMQQSSKWKKAKNTYDRLHPYEFIPPILSSISITSTIMPVKGTVYAGSPPAVPLLNSNCDASFDRRYPAPSCAISTHASRTYHQTACRAWL